MFKLLVKSAWRNSFVRPARTILVVLMIAVSMSMMLSIQGLYDGMSINLIDKNKRSDSGDISIFAKKFRINKEIRYRISNADKIVHEIESLNGVQSVVQRVSADGLLQTARKSSFAQIKGIELQAENRFGRFDEFLKKGKIKLGKRDALVGIELAKTLHLKVGSKVVFSTQDEQGEINSMVFRIAGILQTTNIILDTNAIFVNINRVRGFLGIDKNDAMQIAIMSSNKSLLPLLKSKYPSLEVEDYFHLQPMMQQMQDMTVIFNSITFFIVMSVVFVGIFGVMYVSVLERIREFGIMLAVGMQYKYIRMQIFFEAAFVGFIGFVFGALLGLLMLLSLIHI